MKFIKLKWNAANDAEGYKITIKNNNESVIINEDLGNVLEYAFKNVQRSSVYSWRVTPYNLAGDALNTEFWTFTTEDDIVILPEATTPIYPEDGALEIIVDDDTEIPLPAILKSPPLTYVTNAQYNKNLYLNWELDELSSIVEGVRISIKQNGELIIADEEIEKTDGEFRSTYALRLEPSSKYEWQITPYNSFGDAISDWWTFGTEDALVPGDILLPAILPNPSGSRDLPAGSYLPWNFRWEIDGLSKPTLGCYFSLKENGVLIVDREDIPNTVEKSNRTAHILNPSSTYLWQVIPYDAESEVSDAEWWNFNTTDETQTRAPFLQIDGTASMQPTFSVPENVKMFKHITEFYLLIKYNTEGVNVGTCTGVIPNPNLAGDFNVELSSGSISISWVGEDYVELLDDVLLFTLNFDHNINMNVEGFTQVQFKRIPDSLNRFYNGELLLPETGGNYRNGWINTKRDAGTAPLPLLYKQGTDTVLPHPNSIGLRVTDSLRKLDWMPGSGGHGATGYYVTIKKEDEILLDKVSVSTTWIMMPELLEYETNYSWNVIPYNEYGEAYTSEWWDFKTETEFKRISPIYSVGSIVTSDNSFTVPVTAKNFTDVKLMDMIINYDESVIKCESVNILIPYYMGIAGPNGEGRISISWLLVFDTNTVPDDTPIFNLNFTKVTEGETDITFKTGMETFTGYQDEEGVLEEFNDEPYEDFYHNGLITTTSSNVTTPPDCVNALTPIDGATEVGNIVDNKVKVLFTWESSPIATGYNLHNEISGDIIDVGNITSHRLKLEFNTEYNWKIVPYNEFGNAIDCPIHTFKTLEDDVFNLATSVGTPRLIESNNYEVDVTVKDFLNIGTISLTLDYDEVSIIINEINSNFPLITNDLGYQLRAGWFASSEVDTLSLPDDTVILTIKFTLRPEHVEVIAFNWSKINGECEYAGYGGTPVYSNAIFNDFNWTLNK